MWLSEFDITDFYGVAVSFPSFPSYPFMKVDMLEDG